MFPSSSFAEKRVEGVVSPTDGLVGRHLSVRLDAVLQTVQFPACIADLHAGLSNMDGYALALQWGERNATLRQCTILRTIFEGFREENEMKEAV